MISHLERGVNDILIRAMSQDAAMDVDGHTVLHTMIDIVQDRSKLTAQQQGLQQDLHNLNRMRTKLMEIKCDCPKLEAEIAQVQTSVADLYSKLDSRKYSYAEQALDIQKLFAAAKSVLS